MKCIKCKKKTDKNSSFHTKNKKQATCFKCMNKILKTAKCILCEAKIKGKAFSNFVVKKKYKFLCHSCIKGVKRLR